MSDHSNATAIEVGKEMYFRKDEFFRDWLNNNSEYDNFVNKNKTFIYFGKLYLHSASNNLVTKLKTKAKKLLSYESKVSIEEGMKRFVAWYNNKL